MFRPYGPTMIPAAIIPTMWGIFSLLRITGARSIMTSTIRKIATGFDTRGLMAVGF